ncbi:MAG: hypothetical protein Kow00109_11900 [Acidobacteriota bacterium]
MIRRRDYPAFPCGLGKATMLRSGLKRWTFQQCGSRLVPLPLFFLLSGVGQGWSQDVGTSDEPPVFHTTVDQVVVYAAVYDQQGRLVTDLQQTDFQLFEDRVEQQLTSFAQTEVPTTLGIVIDSSGSMRDKLPQVEHAVDLFLNYYRPSNELFLIRFDDEIELEEDFTRDPDDIRDAVANLIARGGTALYDAIYLAVEKARTGHEPKKVLLVFTDGEDKDSYYRPEELLEKVKEADCQVFLVAFLDEELKRDGGFFGVFRSERKRLQQLLEEIAAVSGGEAFFPEKLADLSPIFERVAQELGNQYRLAYLSSNQARDGSWRRIDVKVKNAKERGLRVRARKGYYAPGPSEASEDPS